MSFLYIVVLPPDSLPIIEGQEGVNMEQPDYANVPIGTSLTSETKEDFTIYTNPLVQLPPAADASVHSSLEGVVDNPTLLDYGLDSPFWRNYMGQAIFELGVIRPSPENPPLGEEE